MSLKSDSTTPESKVRFQAYRDVCRIRSVAKSRALLTAILSIAKDDDLQSDPYCKAQVEVIISMAEQAIEDLDLSNADKTAKIESFIDEVDVLKILKFDQL